MTENESKVVLITGASSGVGAAVARRFAKGGYTLAICARRTDRLEELAGELRQEGAEVITGAVDLRSAESSAAFVRQTIERFGKIDVLANCAGMALGRETADQGDPEDWAAMIETNYSGPVRMMREALPSMKEKGAGHIITIGALAALSPHPGSAIYASAKEAIRAFMRFLREDTLGTGIRVTNVDPGIVRTEFALVRFRGAEEAVSKMLEGMRPLEPEDVAQCVWFAASAPPHVNIDQITVLPTDQTSPTRVHRA